MATDLRDLWDFDDAQDSEERFRDLAASAGEPVATYALTQLARALGLQERYDEGHAVLDALGASDPEARVRVALERGRLLRSAGDPDGSRADFEAAAAEAQRGGLEELNVDALHMVALVVPPDERLEAHWSLRHLGITDLAFEMQLALKAELDAAGERDPYVEEELALLESLRR